MPEPPEWNEIHRRITSNKDDILYRDIKIGTRGLTACGFGGSAISNDVVLLHFDGQLMTESTNRSRKFTMTYQLVEGGKTNVLFAFSATVPDGGAVLIQKSDDHDPSDSALRSLTVWPTRQ